MMKSDVVAADPIPQARGLALKICFGRRINQIDVTGPHLPEMTGNQIG